MMDIVVIAYGQPGLTVRCLSSLITHGPPGSRIILVDNSPTDDTEFTRSMVETVGGTYLRFKENLGIYACFNRGIAAGSQDRIAILCNDVVPLPGALEYMARGLSASAQSYVVAPVEVRGTSYDYGRCISAALMVGGISAGRYTEMRRGFFPAQVYTRSAFEAVGLFDENFRLAFGDTDWEERLYQTGNAIYQSSAAFVYHGQAVTRKRNGVERDVSLTMADQATFRSKWKDYPSVLARHPPVEEGKLRSLTENLFTVGEP